MNDGFSKVRVSDGKRDETQQSRPVDSYEPLDLLKFRDGGSLGCETDLAGADRDLHARMDGGSCQTGYTREEYYRLCSVRRRLWRRSSTSDH